MITIADIKSYPVGYRFGGLFNFFTIKTTKKLRKQDKGWIHQVVLQDRTGEILADIKVDKRNPLIRTTEIYVLIGEKKKDLLYVERFRYDVHNEPPENDYEMYQENLRRTEMRLDEMSNSDYMKRDDVTPPILVTIKSQEPKNMAQSGQPSDTKLIIGFEESDKKLVCNVTNFKNIRRITDEADSKDWIGKQIVLWFNPDIEFGGETVGGIRVRERRDQNTEAEVETVPF